MCACGDGSYTLLGMEHRFDTRVRWADLDPYWHVNHATYLSYCEAARIRLLDDIGWSMQALEARDLRIVVVEVTARWLRPALVDMDLVVVTRVGEMGRVRSTWHQQIVAGDAVLFEVDVQAVFTDATGKPRRIPEGFADAVR